MMFSESQLNEGQTSTLPAYIRLQHTLLAACIVLGPIGFTVYALTWDGAVNPIATSASVGATANALHLISGLAASLFLPVGYLGMALLGMKRSPWLATISAILAPLSWIPLAALMGIDDLAYDIALRGSTPQLAALWTSFNGDSVMLTYLYIYAISHLVSTILLGILLRRARLIPIWAAWALIISSPLTIISFALDLYRGILLPLVCILLVIGSLPAAFAMWRNKDL